MKNKRIVKNLTLYASLVVTLFTISSSSMNKRSKEYYLPNYVIEKGKIGYSQGTIYIGDENYLNEIELNYGDMRALDQRNDSDPNVKLYDSYKVDDPRIRDEIIEGLLCYEEVFPSNWYRTKKSATREWTTHNTFYRLGVFPTNTKDVDLNNGDENIYKVTK